MLTPERKKRAALTILPVYLLLWVVVTGCSTEFRLYLLCAFLFGRQPAAVAETEGVGVVMSDGDFVFEDNFDETLANKKRVLVASTEFAFPTRIPESDITLSGAFSPFGRATEARRAQPRKIDVEFVHTNEKGKKQARDKYRLKVKNGDIRELTQTSSEMEIDEGERLEIYLKPKGNDLDLTEPLQIFWSMTQPERLAGAMRAGLGQALVASTLRKAEQELFTTTFGVNTNLPATEWRFAGSASSGNRVASGLVDRLVPSSVDVTFEHLDAEGEVVDDFTFTVQIVNGGIPSFAVPFPGFALAAGESLRMSVNSRGGNFDIGDLFGLNVVMF